MEGAYRFWLEGGWHVSGRCILVLVERWMGSKEFFSCSPMELAFGQEVTV